MAELTFSLSHPGMSDLHKAGLGGLYMTLLRLQGSRKKIAGLHFELTPTGIVLKLDDATLKTSLSELISYSFQIDKDGFFYFPALELNGIQPIENRILNHKALLNTFFQPTLKSSTTEKVGMRSFAGEEKRPLVITVPKLKSYASQNSLAMFCDSRKGGLHQEIDIINWMFLGGAVKHSGLGNHTKLSESCETAFPLLYACVGIVFLSVKVFDPHLRTKARACMAIPKISDLQDFSRMRSEIAQMNELRITVAGLSEASLFLGQQFFASEQTLVEDGQIVVMTIGDIKWNSTQKNRTAVKRFLRQPPIAMEQYSIVSRILKARYQLAPETRDKKGKIKQPASSYINMPISRELFCDNIAMGKPFYENFYRLVRPQSSASGKTQYKIHYERKELNELMEKIQYDHEHEKIFVKVCHTAWRHRLGKLGSESKKPGSGSFGNLVSRDFERLRVALTKSKNLESFRETITDFWARAGNIPELRDGWEQVMTLLEPENWKKGRDLALLALVSYKPERKEDEQALVELATAEGEDDE